MSMQRKLLFSVYKGNLGFWSEPKLLIFLGYLTITRIKLPILYPVLLPKISRFVAYLLDTNLSLGGRLYKSTPSLPSFLEGTCSFGLSTHTLLTHTLLAYSQVVPYSQVPNTRILFFGKLFDPL